MPAIGVVSDAYVALKLLYSGGNGDRPGIAGG